MHRTYFDLELPSGELLEVCATLSADGDVMEFTYWSGDLTGWMRLGDGFDFDDLRERAKEAATAAAMNWP